MANLAPVVVLIHRPPVKKAALTIGISFIVLGVFIPAVTTVVTFLLPEAFASSARVLYATNNAAPLDTAVGKITSRSSLDQVVTNLNLTTKWSRKYKQPGELSLARCSEMLYNMIQISSPRASPLLEIKVLSDDRNEAAAIANNLAAVYLRAAPGTALIESAEPRLKAVRPNKRLNITIGAFAGVTLLIVGIGLLVAVRIAAKQR